MTEHKNLDAILEELYAADPSLRAQEPMLRKLAAELLASKPEAPIDATFVAKLRSELMARASVRPSWSASLSNFMKSRNAFYLVPGLAVLALAVVATVNLAPRHAGTPAASHTLALSSGVERLGEGAFGELSAQPVGQATDSASPEGAMRESQGTAPMAMDVPTAPPSPTTAPMALPPMAGGGATGSSKMVMPVDWTPTYFKYVYKGDPIEGLADKVDVYRRVKVSAGAGPVGALQNFDLGLIDLGKLKDASVQSFTVTESRPDGYVVSVNPEEGTVNVYENGKTSYPERQCADQACIDSYRLKESDMPADEATIRIADSFLDELGISKDGYGKPVVRDDWRVNYMATTDKASFWFPDTVMVVYPYLLDGKVAMDESGAPYGLNVNVNVTHKRGTSLWNLSVAKFQTSSYAAETDAKRLIGIAEKGGLQGGGMMDNAKIVEVELGTPTIAYTRVWQWNAEGGTELFAPSLVFPILNAPKDVWLTNIVVPLAQDLLKTIQDQGGQPVPMPYIR